MREVGSTERKQGGVPSWQAARIEELSTALKNVMGYLDTPIARRKLGISADAEWLQDARSAVSGKGSTDAKNLG